MFKSKNQTLWSKIVCFFAGLFGFRKKNILEAKRELVSLLLGKDSFGGVINTLEAASCSCDSTCTDCSCTNSMVDSVMRVQRSTRLNVEDYEWEKPTTIGFESYDDNWSPEAAIAFDKRSRDVGNEFEETLPQDILDIIYPDRVVYEDDYSLCYAED
jgi:hypothetical protein